MTLFHEQRPRMPTLPGGGQVNRSQLSGGHGGVQRAPYRPAAITSGSAPHLPEDDEDHVDWRDFRTLPFVPEASRLEGKPALTPAALGIGALPLTTPYAPAAYGGLLNQMGQIGQLTRMAAPAAGQAAKTIATMAPGIAAGAATAILTTPANRTAPVVTDWSQGQRLVRRVGEAYGEVQRPDTNGGWVATGEVVDPDTGASWPKGSGTVAGPMDIADPPDPLPGFAPYPEEPEETRDIDAERAELERLLSGPLPGPIPSPYVPEPESYPIDELHWTDFILENRAGSPETQEDVMNLGDELKQRLNNEFPGLDCTVTAGGRGRKGEKLPERRMGLTNRDSSYPDLNIECRDPVTGMTLKLHTNTGKVTSAGQPIASERRQLERIDRNMEKPDDEFRGFGRKRKPGDDPTELARENAKRVMDDIRDQIAKWRNDNTN